MNTTEHIIANAFYKKLTTDGDGLEFDIHPPEGMDRTIYPNEEKAILQAQFAIGGKVEAYANVGNAGTTSQYCTLRIYVDNVMVEEYEIKVEVGSLGGSVWFTPVSIKPLSIIKITCTTHSSKLRVNNSTRISGNIVDNLDMYVRQVI